MRLHHYRNSHRSLAHQNAFILAYARAGVISGTPGSVDIATAREQFEQITQSALSDEAKDALLDALLCNVSNNVIGGVATSLYQEILSARLELVGNG